jgi:acyl-coenzyme A thioesterase PaaI-like protein
MTGDFDGLVGSAVTNPDDELLASKVAAASQLPWSAQIGMCVGCAKGTSGCRVGMHTEWRDGPNIYGRAVLGEQHEGGPGTAHGGFVASLLDEILGHLPWSEGRFAVTQQLSVTYLRPTPLNRELLLAAAADSVEAGRWAIHGDVRLSSTDEVLAMAHGVWVERRISHYARTRQWLAQDSDQGN